MSRLLDHKWGESAAVDRVWSQIAGLRPSAIDGRMMLMLQAYMDESQDSDVVVLGGAVASTEEWANFSKDWEELLPLGTLRKDGRRHFKFSEMHGRIDDIPAFWHVLQSHVRFLIESTVELKMLIAARSRIEMVSPIDWNDTNDQNYMLAFKMIMEGFHHYRKELGGLVQNGEKVDFYFDEHSNKRIVRDSWDDWMNRLSEQNRSNYGHEPRFEDDMEFLPLQGADLVAGLVRAQKRTDFGRAVSDLLAKHRKRSIPMISLSYTEDELVKSVAAKIQNQGFPIIDKKTGQRLRGADD